MKEKETKKETDTEMIIRLILGGFARVENRLYSLETDMGDVKHSVSTLEHSVSTLQHSVSTLQHSVSTLEHSVSLLETEMDEVKHSITNIHTDLRDMDRHLDSIDRKQAGMLESLDETVHRNEFRRLEKRVEALEV